MTVGIKARACVSAAVDLGPEDTTRFLELHDSYVASGMDANAAAKAAAQGLISEIEAEAQQIGDAIKEVGRKKTKERKKAVGITDEASESEVGEFRRLELIRELKKAGGVRMSDSSDITGETPERSTQLVPTLFRNNGMGLDMVAEWMKERGYIAQNTDGQDAPREAAIILRAAIDREGVFTISDLDDVGMRRFAEKMAGDSDLTVDEAEEAIDLMPDDLTLDEVADAFDGAAFLQEHGITDIDAIEALLERAALRAKDDTSYEQAVREEALAESRRRDDSDTKRAEEARAVSEKAAAEEVARVEAAAQAEREAAEAAAEAKRVAMVEAARAFAAEVARLNGEPAPAVKPKESKANKVMGERRARLEEHFTPGNIILSDYWKAHDRVIAFNWNDGSWSVKVERVKKDGDQWVQAEPPRQHSTMPDAKDKIVENVEPALLENPTPETLQAKEERAADIGLSDREIANRERAKFALAAPTGELEEGATQQGTMFGAQEETDAEFASRKYGTARASRAELGGALKPPLKAVQGEPTEATKFESRSADSAFMRWFGDSKVVDENGKPKRVYHGTGRPDRVGNRFRRSRATSGPMPYFTDSPAIASGYATGKQDTSMTGDELGYDQWFLFKPKGARTPRSITQMWWELTPEQRTTFNSRLRDIRQNEENGDIELGGTDEGISPSQYAYELQNARGNGIKAAIELWLNSGSLIGYNDDSGVYVDREAEFLDVLRLAGMPMRGIDFVPQNGTMPAVMPMYLRITNPLDTRNVPQSVVNALHTAGRRKRARRGGRGDIWDKENRDPKEWLAQLDEDVTDGKNSYVWTSIPDWVTDALQSLGYDGIFDTGNKADVNQGHAVYIPFKPEQIKSATGNRGTFNPDSDNILESRAPFYSELSQQTEALNAKAMTPGDWSVRLRALKVKPDELHFSGVLDWLATHDDKAAKISKADLTAFLDSNGVKVEETVLGEHPAPEARDQAEREYQQAADAYEEARAATDGVDGLEGWTAGEMLYYGGQFRAGRAIPTPEARISDEAKAKLIAVVEAADAFNAARRAAEEIGLQQLPTKHPTQVLPGGKPGTYREFVLTLPVKGLDARKAIFDKWKPRIEAQRRILDAMVGLDDRDVAQTELESIERHRDAEANDASTANEGTFTQGHYDQPNVIAHVRANERTDADGKRVLFIEEVQSDWAQKGRKGGFTGEAARASLKAQARLTEIERQLGLVLPEAEQETLRTEHNQVAAEYARAEARRARHGDEVPSAPFVGKTDAWVALSLKRMIRYAAENGFDRVAWTTGEQQAARYDLSKQISSVTATKFGDKYSISMRPLGGGERIEAGVFVAEKLPDAVGKELASKITEQSQFSMTYTDTDLKVGGEGMKAFYDTIVPKVANDILKKLGGGRVGNASIGGPKTADELAASVYGSGETYRNLPSESKRKIDEMIGNQIAQQPGFDITPQMRETVMAGQALFTGAGTFDYFTKKYTGAATPEQALADARAELKRFGVPVLVKMEVESRPSDPDVLMSYDLRWRVIRYNTASPHHTHAQDVQGFIEELLHATDHLGGRTMASVAAGTRTLSASMTRLAMGGDLRAEVMRGWHSQFSQELTRFLDYPLNSADHPDLSPDRVTAELYARLGVLYIADPELFQQVAPRTYEAYDGIFRGQQTGSLARAGVDGAVQRDVSQNDAARIESTERLGQVPGKSSVGDESGATGQISAGQTRDNAGSGRQQAADRLEELRQRSVQALGGDPAGAVGDYRELESRTSAPTGFGRIIDPVTHRLKIGEKGYEALEKYVGDGIFAKVGLASNAPPAFRRMLGQYRTDKGKATDAARDVVVAGKTLAAGEAVMISDYIDEELTAGVVPPSHIVDVATTMIAAEREQTKELVDLKMLRQETADRMDGHYLPRFYDKHDGKKGVLARMFRPTIRGNHMKARGQTEIVSLDKVPEWEALGYEVREDIPTGSSNTVAVWRDWSKEQRVKWGEKRDAVYRFARGMLETGSDIASARLFQRIANSEFATPSREIAAQREWEQVPDEDIAGTSLKKYGALSGMYVDPAVWKELKWEFREKGAFERTLAELTALWKEGKTAMNPATHAANVVSSIVMADFAGISPLNAKAYLSALNDLLHDGSATREAKNIGLLGGEAIHELRQWLPDASALNSASTPGAIAAAFNSKAVTMLGKYTGASFYRENMRKLYGAEDAFFKILIFKHYTGRGMSATDAATEANRYIFDYRDLPPLIQFIRDSALGVPFITYTYKAIPAVVHTILTRPWIVLKYAALFNGINMLAFAIGGGDEEDERKNMPKYMKGWTPLFFPTHIRMMSDAADNPQFLNIARLTPLGTVFQPTNGEGIPMINSIMPNHPIYNMIQTFFGNRDTLTGRDFFKPSDDMQDRVTKGAKYVYQQLMPSTPLLPGSHSFNKVINGVSEAIDRPIDIGPFSFTGKVEGRSGREETLPKALANTVAGVNLRGFDVDEQRQYRRRALQREIGEIKANIKRINLNEGISEETKDARREREFEKRDKLHEQLSDL